RQGGRPIVTGVTMANPTTVDEGQESIPVPGTYRYTITFVDDQGLESEDSEAISATLTEANNAIKLAPLPVGPATTKFRRIYRTDAGTTTGYKLIGIVDGNAPLDEFIDSSVSRP